MGQSHSLAVHEEEPLVFDVEEVLAEGAWNSFLHSYDCLSRRFIKRKNFTIEVPMTYYHFEQGEQKEELLEHTHTTHGLADTDGMQYTSRGRDTLGIIRLETRFNNDTDNDQKYNFNFQKERTAFVEITYQRGYSIGCKANFTIGIPKMLGDGQLGAEMETHVTVTKSTGERHEEKITTSVTSEITVAPHSHCIATVVMEEQTLVAKFTMPVTMKLLAGRGEVYIKAKKTGEVVFIQSVTNLPFYFINFLAKRKQKESGGETNTYIAYLDPTGKEVKDPEKSTDKVVFVRFTVEGLMKGIRLSNHCINLKQTEAVTTNTSTPPFPDVRPRTSTSSATRPGSGPSERRDAARP